MPLFLKETKLLVLITLLMVVLARNLSTLRIDIKYIFITAMLHVGQHVLENLDDAFGHKILCDHVTTSIFYKQNFAFHSAAVGSVVTLTFSIIDYCWCLTAHLSIGKLESLLFLVLASYFTMAVAKCAPGVALTTTVQPPSLAVFAILLARHSLKIIRFHAVMTIRIITLTGNYFAANDAAVNMFIFIALKSSIALIFTSSLLSILFIMIFLLPKQWLCYLRARTAVS